ncbi:MAG: DNA sulfur modification protein DndD [Myxococcales bacterium]
MRLNQLVLRDFGLFRGRQELSLAPKTKYGKARPVVLIGGHNGAGKTTILEAIRLCLYGRLALGSRVREEDYLRYLREHVHRDRSALLQANSASVAIEFDFARGAVRKTYLVERSWTIEGEKVTETLSVFEDGKPLEEIDSEFWPDFLRSLVPPGLSQLFFFDGEKIQKLAEDESDTVALADSVKALLGLDLVERLQADLDLYVSREARKGKANGQTARLPALEKELVAQQEQLAALREKEEDLSNQVDTATKEVERVEQLLALGGQGLADKRLELKQRKARLATRADEIARGLRELCDGPVVVAACPKLAAKLLQQLELEAEAERWKSARDEVSRALDSLSGRILAAKNRKKLGLTDEGRHFLEELFNAMRVEAPPKHVEGLTILQGLSPRERDEVGRIIRQAISESGQAAQRACSELVKTEQQLSSVQERINKAPETDEIAPRIKELSELHARESEARVELSKIETERIEVEKRLGLLQREQRRLLETVSTSGKASKKLDLAQRTRRTLDDYLRKLTAAKMQQLEEATAACFAELCRKSDFVRSISINPETFQIELIDRNGQKMPKLALSAGEKQLYAISVLWGLAKVSGRPLPMIIDTPLGRLDSIHRGKLIDNYFPRASHQVIVLSTDTEVDSKYFESLQPYLSHAIHLSHQADGWTLAEQGYFWKEPAGGAASN